jgi:hypothetical protein
MATTHSAARRSGLALALVLALAVCGLAIDALVRVVSWRDRLETTGFVALASFEVLRIILVAGAMVLAVIAERRGDAHAAVPWFGLGMLLLSVAVARGLTGPLPGAGQEALATSLLARGIPLQVLAILFVRAEWVAWLALPPLLRFAANYPRVLTGADVTSGALAARAGTLRGVPGAGADVGVLLRRLAARALAGGWPDSVRVRVAAAVAGALHTLAVVYLEGAARVVIAAAALLVGLLVVALVLVLLRAGSVVASSSGVAFHAALFRGMGVTAGLLLIAALTSAVGVAQTLGTVALYLAPLTLLAAAFRGVIVIPAAPAHVRR